MIVVYTDPPSAPVSAFVSSIRATQPGQLLQRSEPTEHLKLSHVSSPLTAWDLRRCCHVFFTAARGGAQGRAASASATDRSAPARLLRQLSPLEFFPPAAPCELVCVCAFTIKAGGMLPACVCKLPRSRLTPCGEFVHDGLAAHPINLHQDGRAKEPARGW